FFSASTRSAGALPNVAAIFRFANTVLRPSTASARSLSTEHPCSVPPYLLSLPPAVTCFDVLECRWGSRRRRTADLERNRRRKRAFAVEMKGRDQLFQGVLGRVRGIRWDGPPRQ